MLRNFSASSLVMLRNFYPSSIAFNPSFPSFTGRQGSFHGQQKQTLNYSFRRLLHHNRILNCKPYTSYDPIFFDNFPKFERDQGSGTSIITSNKYKKLANGIQYMDVDEGTGSHPEKNKKVEIDYKLYDVDTKLQDFKRTQIMVGKEEFRPGFDEAIGNMKEGGRRIIIIPPSLAKGEDYIIYDVIMCKA